MKLNSNYTTGGDIDYQKLKFVFSGLHDRYLDVPSVCIWNFNCVQKEEKAQKLIVDKENYSFTLENIIP
jgi:hypothetical protein|tara:strand:- start:670 stop:876 length:207 start_codon:yes stop_codon:yes gene_type:complete